MFLSKGKRESEFIGIISQRKDFIIKMTKYRQGVVYGQWRIHEKDFLKISIRIPNEKEQEAISNFFKKLDDALALNQQKLGLYKEQKKGFMQKMFV
ncbi:restriction endonuclease subunit S [Staphylococcus pseudintermedius]|uniref:restriction endonuclease subunit S n=1 Tax=Staphylococcus pseudintermedius TaxID=283734 RepID=UPI0030B8577C